MWGDASNRQKFLSYASYVSCFIYVDTTVTSQSDCVTMLWHSDLSLSELNIATGTTDLGYWVHNLRNFFQPKLFQIHLSQNQMTLLARLSIWPPDGATCIGCKFGHQVAQPAITATLATRCYHLHCHITWDCPIGIISCYWFVILISQSHIS